MQHIRQAATSGWANISLPEPASLDAMTTLAAYESLRALMPENAPRNTRQIARLRDLIDEVEGFILDGYGVINLGSEMIPGIAEFFSQAEAAGRPVIVLTNGASFPSTKAAAKYANWNLPVKAGHVVSSRDATLALLTDTWSAGRLMTLGRDTTPLQRADALHWGQDNPDEADGFVFLGAVTWDEDQHQQLVSCLIDRPRPVYIANPDISAPQKQGFSAEPGYWALRLMQEAQIHPIWCGKPHAPAFELALAHMDQLAGKPVPRHQIAMVGDSLHTDILGANHQGLKSVLLTGYGLLKGLDWQAVVDSTGIHPDIQTDMI